MPETESLAPAAPPPTQPAAVAISVREFWWLTLGVWLGGIFILTLMPILLIPRIGLPLGVAGSYLIFFVAWQPVQSITQRYFGVRTALIRMIIFVGGAATLAFYLRESLLALTRAN